MKFEFFNISYLFSGVKRTPFGAGIEYSEFKLNKVEFCLGGCFKAVSSEAEFGTQH